MIVSALVVVVIVAIIIILALGCFCFAVAWYRAEAENLILRRQRANRAISATPAGELRR